jgi:hypothetical protein
MVAQVRKEFQTGRPALSITIDKTKQGFLQFAKGGML